MQNFYFTFGIGQPNQGYFHKIVANSWNEARDLMIEKFGKKWAFQYEESDWIDKNGVSQQQKWNYKELK